MARNSKKNTPDASDGGVSRAYIDTHYLLALVFGENDAEDARHLLYTLRRPNYHVLVPQTILGEVVAKILQRYESDDVSDRFQKHGQLFADHGIDQSCLPGVCKGAGYHMFKLQFSDKLVTMSQILNIMDILSKSKKVPIPQNYDMCPSFTVFLACSLVQKSMNVMQ